MMQKKQVIFLIITAIRIHKHIIKMKATIFALAILCLSHGALSLDCDDGYYPTTAFPGARQVCHQCRPFCTKCTGTGNGDCQQLNSMFKGVTQDSNGDVQILCGQPLAAGFGYDPDTGRCEFCLQGCLSCYIDAAYCEQCRSGWEFNDHKCYKAEVGLGATMLVFSFLMAAGSILACLFVRNK